MELLLNNHPTDSGKPFVSSLYQVSETRVQSLIARDRYWLQQIDGDALLAVLRCLAGYVESTVPRKNSALAPAHDNRFGSVKCATRNGYQSNQLQSSSGVRERVEAKPGDTNAFDAIFNDFLTAA